MERPLFSAPAATPAASATPQLGAVDLNSRYKQLKQEHERLNENRFKRTLMLQQATEEDNRCRQEASSFGADTPEELEKILIARRDEAARELDAFEAALAKEAQIQAEVEQNLAASENR